MFVYCRMNEDNLLQCFSPKCAYSNDVHKNRNYEKLCKYHDTNNYNESIKINNEDEITRNNRHHFHNIRTNGENEPSFTDQTHHTYKNNIGERYLKKSVSLKTSTSSDSSSVTPSDTENDISTLYPEDADNVGHCHLPTPDLEYERKSKKKLLIACLLCLIFMIAEIVGGILSGSLAIATDAAHLLTDIAGFMISLLSMCISSLPARPRLHYGWYRAEIIGAVLSVFLIWAVTTVLCYMATMRIIHGDFELEGGIMLIMSIIGVVINIIMGILLHEKPEKSTVNKQNINVRAAFIHVIGDLFQSIGVMIASIIIFIKPQWKIVDPLCTYSFSILVLITTITILSDAIVVLMEGAPKGLDHTHIAQLLLSVNDVQKIHNLRMWSLGLDKTILVAHMVVNPESEKNFILTSLMKKIDESELEFFEITFQLEDNTPKRQLCALCVDRDNEFGSM